MKSVIRLTVSGVVILLLAVSMASAHGSGPGSHMGDERMQNMMSDGHMMDMSEYMDISGTIDVTNAIQLTISVTPNAEMLSEMDGHMRGHQMMNTEDYMNQIVVSFTQIVEFEDATGDGYTPDDTMISYYNLDNTTLNAPILVNNEYYEITSDSTNIFSMKIDLSFDNDLFYGFKWSLEMNYQFQSNTSDLAMLHSIETSNGNMMQYNHGMQYQNGEYQYEAHHFNYMEEHQNRMPMFFEWATSVVVDNVEYNVTATSFDQMLALSVPQGANIQYDPQIGVSPNSISEADTTFGSAFKNFFQTLLSPTSLGLLMGLLVLGIISVTSFVLKRRSA